MTDRERLIEILSDNKLWCPSKKTQWGRVADAILAAGTYIPNGTELASDAEIAEMVQRHEAIVAEKDKRIAELTQQLEQYTSLAETYKAAAEGKDGG